MIQRYGGMPHPSILAALSREKVSAAGLTLMLHHFNGADEGAPGATDATDLSWTYSNASLETSSPVAGLASTACLHMDTGSSNGIGHNLVLNTASSWTAEVFAAGETTGKNASGGPFSGRISDDSICWQIIAIPSPINTMRLILNDATGSAISDTTVSISATNALFHIALVFNGSSYQAYFNGSRTHNITSSTSIRTPTRVFLGSSSALSTGNSWDEVRVSQTARYTGASLTVPTAEFTLD